MLKFICGKHPNDGFKILDAETDKDLTEAIMPTKVDILISMRPNETNKARMEVYAEGLEILVDRVETTVIEPGYQGKEKTIWRDYEIEKLHKEIDRLGKRLQRIDRSVWSALTAHSNQLTVVRQAVTGLLKIFEEKQPPGSNPLPPETKN